MKGKNIKELVCYSKGGRITLSAKLFIDATGDADVAAYAGVPYETGGKDYKGYNMSTTLAFRMANVNLPKYGEANRQCMMKNG